MLIKVRLSVYQLFVSFHFSFFVSFGDEVMKILRNLCLHFARQDGQDGNLTYSILWNKRSPLNKHSPWKIWQKE